MMKNDFSTLAKFPSMKTKHYFENSGLWFYILFYMFLLFLQAAHLSTHTLSGLQQVN